jgi:hypothetical protein
MNVYDKLIILCMVILGIACCPGTPDCAQCESSWMCKSCIDSLWNPIINACQPIPSERLIKTCIKYGIFDFRLSCDTCEFGYEMINGYCIAYPSNCAIGNAHQKTCYSCFDQRVVDPDTRQCTEERRCKTENCSACNDDSFGSYDSCFLCKEGYSLFRKYGQSAQCLQGFEGCLYLDDDKDHCDTCTKGYYITSDYMCAKIPPSASSVNFVSDSGRSSDLFRRIKEVKTTKAFN